MADVTETNGAVETNGSAAPGANTEASPASTSSPTTPSQATSPANTPANGQENLPFHEHPRFKELTKRNAEFRRQNEEANRKLAELEAKFSGFTAGQKPSGPNMSTEDAQALEKLMDMMSQHPKFQERFGLGQTQQVQQELQRIQEQQLGEKFDGEFSKVQSLAKTLGLDPAEVEDEMREAFQSHPVYSNLDYRPGLVEQAFRSIYFDRIGELKEREYNRRMIQETEAKKKANTEGVGTPSAPGSGMRPGESPKDFMLRRVNEGGGIDFKR